MPILKVRVFPNSKKQKIVKRKLDELWVYLCSKPQKGLANEELITLLAKYFNTLSNNIKIIRGQRRRNKIVKITQP